MIETVKQNESALIDVLKSAAVALDAVGITELSDALAQLQRSAEAAQERLQQAADQARAVLLALSSRSEGVAKQLHADLFGAVEPEAAPVTQEGTATTPGASETAPEPSDRVKAVREALDAIEDASLPAPEGGVVETLVSAAIEAEREVVQPDGAVSVAPPPSPNGRRLRRGSARKGGSDR